MTGDRFGDDFNEDFQIIPSGESSMPAEAWAVYREAYAQSMSASVKPIKEAAKDAAAGAQKALEAAGWRFARIGWVKEYAAPKMRNVMGVRIFEIGTWTDSSGNIREWAEADLDVLVKAFASGIPSIVPLKAGHTPDTFNSQIAEKLGVPVDLVIGDHGKGQITIGRMATLERRGNILFASFERVPDSIAGLIEQGLYRTVSVEIEDNIDQFAQAITAVALLGAEEPAVAGATLDRALVFGGKRDHAQVLTFAQPDSLEGEFSTLYDKMAETIKGMRGAPVFRALMQNLRGLFDQITKKHKHESPQTTAKEDKMPKPIKDLRRMQEEIPPEAPPEAIEPEPVDEVMAALIAIAQALGLSDDSSVEDILGAIEQLKAGAAPVEAQFQKTKSELQKANERIGKLEHSERVHGYLEQTRLFTAVPNRKAEDMAVELAELEEIAGKPRAEALLRTYQDLQSAGAAASKVLGTSVPGARTADYEAKVTEYMKDKPDCTRAQAHKAVMTAHPDLREQYRQDISD